VARVVGFVELRARVTKALEAGFSDTMQLFHRHVVESIGKPMWDWDRSPSPRDIVDTGALRAAESLTFLSSTHAIEGNSIEYALPVHEGATFEDGHTTPARPWLRVARREFDWQGTARRVMSL
jgi:hypothetical protein